MNPTLAELPGETVSVAGAISKTDPSPVVRMVVCRGAA
jgi:hypothetical protein